MGENVNTPSKAVLPVEICPRVEEKIQTLKVSVVEKAFCLETEIYAQSSIFKKSLNLKEQFS